MSKLLKGLLAGSGLVAMQAQAAIPTNVSTAITDSVTDVNTLGALILVVCVAVAGFNWLRKPVH